MKVNRLSLETRDTSVMRSTWMFLPTTQCLVSGGTSYASVYGALRGLYMAGDLSLCICLCDHEIPLVMSPMIQATGWQIVHILVLPHLMLSFAYSGEPLPTHSMGIFASSPPGGVTPHSARKVQKNARQWHSIRAEGPSNVSWRSRRALQPTCRSRRALK